MMAFEKVKVRLDRRVELERVAYWGTAINELYAKQRLSIGGNGIPRSRLKETR